MKMWPQTDQLKFHNEKFTVFTIQKLVQIYSTNMCTQKKNPTYSHDRISTYERCPIKHVIYIVIWRKLKDLKKIYITRDYQVCRSRMGNKQILEFHLLRSIYNYTDSIRSYIAMYYIFTSTLHICLCKSIPHYNYQIRDKFWFFLYEQNNTYQIHSSFSFLKQKNVVQCCL